jgi:hypothetical protein
MNIPSKIPPAYPPSKDLRAPCSLYSIRPALFFILAFSGNGNQSFYGHSCSSMSLRFRRTLDEKIFVRASDMGIPEGAEPLLAAPENYPHVF